MLTALAVSLVGSPLACGEALVLDDSDAHDGGANESDDGSAGEEAGESRVPAPPGADARPPDGGKQDERPVPAECTETPTMLECDCGQGQCDINCRNQPKPCRIRCFGGSSCTLRCKDDDAFTCTGQGTSCTVIGCGGCNATSGANCKQG